MKEKTEPINITTSEVVDQIPNLDSVKGLFNDESFLVLYSKGIETPKAMFSQIHNGSGVQMDLIKIYLLNMYDLESNVYDTASSAEIMLLLLNAFDFVTSVGSQQFIESKDYSPKFKRDKSKRDKKGHIHKYNLEWLLEETIEFIEEVRACSKEGTFSNGTSEDVTIKIFEILTEMKDMMFLFDEYDMNEVLKFIDGGDGHPNFPHSHDLKFISDFIKSNPFGPISELLLIDIFLFDYIKSNGRKDFCFADVAKASHLIKTRFQNVIK